MKKRWRRHFPLYALIAITVLPVAAAYFVYYIAPPAGRTNYGTLLVPQRSIAELPLANLDGTRFDVRKLAGSWVLLMVDGGDCDKPCADKLLMMRQQRTMAGRNREQIERVWLISDQEPLPIVLMREYEGTHFVRAPLHTLRELLVLPDNDGARLQDPIWLVDPRGNLMLRWPKNPVVNGVKRDIARLLKVSAGWIRIDPRPAQSDPQ